MKRLVLIVSLLSFSVGLQAWYTFESAVNDFNLIKTKLMEPGPLYSGSGAFTAISAIRDQAAMFLDVNKVDVIEFILHNVFFMSYQELISQSLEQKKETLRQLLDELASSYPARRARLVILQDFFREAAAPVAIIPSAVGGAGAEERVADTMLRSLLVGRANLRGTGLIKASSTLVIAQATKLFGLNDDQIRAVRHLESIRKELLDDIVREINSTTPGDADNLTRAKAYFIAQQLGTTFNEAWKSFFASGMAPATEVRAPVAVPGYVPEVRIISKVNTNGKLSELLKSLRTAGVSLDDLNSFKIFVNDYSSDDNTTPQALEKLGQIAREFNHGYELTPLENAILEWADYWDMMEAARGGGARVPALSPYPGLPTLPASAYPPLPPAAKAPDMAAGLPITPFGERFDRNNVVHIEYYLTQEAADKWGYLEILSNPLIVKKNNIPTV